LVNHSRGNTMATKSKGKKSGSKVRVRK